MNPVANNAVPSSVSRKRGLRMRPVLAAMLAAGAILPVFAAEPAVRAMPAKVYALPSAPLADVLNRFAAESGVVLVFDADQLRGVQSKGLQGKYDVSSGFQALLAESKFEVVMGASGGYMLRARPAPVRDEQAALERRGSHTLSEITVEASTLPTVERLDREMIRNMPAINGDMTSQLKLNPNIQFDESALAAATGGEIAPAEISIHGAKPYQNEILVDGISISNDIDPGNKVTSTSVDQIPGASQALAIDSSILCEIDVKDSNVSAEYGRFTGGVVSATVCSARKKFGGNVSVGYTSSDWSKLYIDPARQEEFENSSSDQLQPRFRKWTYKTTVEARPSEDWGVLMNVVRRKSEIPLKRFSTENANTTTSREVTQTRQQDTLLVKADYTPAGSRHKGEVTMVYAPSSNTYFMENYRDSNYTIDSGGLNLSGKWESRYDLAKLTHQVSYSKNEQSRRSDVDYYRAWRWSDDKNWGDPTRTNPTSGEGARGDIDQEVRTVAYKFGAAFMPFNLGSTKHRVNAGLELRRQDADYERLRDHFYYLTPSNLLTTGNSSRCMMPDGTVDTQACSTTRPLRYTAGQYFGRLMTYRAGKFDVSNNSWAAYAEDEATWRDLSLRVGVRGDRDSLAGGTNFAPRLRLGWQATDPLSLDVGANRYYGRSMFAFALQEKANTLLATQTRTSNLVWGTPVISRPLNRLEDMKSPYDDEFTVGGTYESQALAGPVSLRFTRRTGKDQVVRLVRSGQADCNGGTCYIFSNDGGSVSKDVTLSWSNSRAFKIGDVANRMWVAVNKSDVESNYATYAENYGNAMLRDDLIRYDGRIIRNSERPAENYNRPWTLRIGAMSTWPAQSLTVSNILRIRGGYEKILRNGSYVYEGASLENYEKTRLPQSNAIDTVVNWNPRVYRSQRLDVKLTIENITNQKNKMTVNDTYASYERGRTFALEIGYGF
ncbi:TonB-dependent receptor [Janthinobacterium aquaticum]|nr:TonB-dependent receptor [Janthinobacterium sp. FT58W]